jgi:hypothetical protein
MANGSAPPQAYTREVLGVAFNWLQSQPESVRKQATTPNALVGLYMRAQRQGPGQSSAGSDNLEAPVSAQNFMNDLRNLAEGLKQFEEPASQSIYSHPAPQQAPVASYSVPVYSAPFTPNPAHSSAGPAYQTQVHHAPQQGATGPSAADILNAQIISQMNAQSRAMIEEVRTQFNLSSSHEAVNMMMAIAYKNLKSLLG